METFTPITGGCLCNQVRYEICTPPYDPHYCHCRTCQKASGAPAIAGVFVPTEALTFTHTVPKFYQSSPIVERGFCNTCGTYLIYRPLIQEWSNWVIVTIASLDAPNAIVPQIHYGTESQITWFQIDDNLPRERYPENFVDILTDENHAERQAIIEQFTS